MDPGTGVVKGASPSTPSLVELPEVYVGGITPGPVLGHSRRPEHSTLQAGVGHRRPDT